MNKIKKILEITTHEMRYLDDSGQENAIDFAECRAHWIEHVLTSPDFDVDSPEEYQRTTRCVGQRDAFAQPMYFEFFTIPRTRLELPRPFWRWRVARRTFQAISDALREAGWTTFDLG